MALPTASDNVFPKLITAMQATDPAAPSDSSWKIYSKAGGIYARSSNSIVGPFSTGAGGSVATDAIWDAAGDLVQGTGANTAAKLSAGTAGMFLKSAGAAAANLWAFPPGHQLDYVAKTTNTSITHTSEATADTIITGNSVAYDGVIGVRIEFFACSVQPDSAAAGRYIQFVLLEDSTVIGLPAFLRTPAAASMNAPVMFSVHRTPSNASHTYTVQAYVNAGTGTVSAGSGGTGANVAAFLRIVKV